MKFSCKVSGMMVGVSPVLEVAMRGVVKDFDGANKLNIEAKKDGIYVSSFNGRVAISSTISDASVDNLVYNLDTEGSVTVNAKDLQNVLQSFTKNEEIDVEVLDGQSGGKEFVVSKKHDAEEYMTLPCASAPVNIPDKSDKFGSLLIMDRSTFVHGINKVFFAVGFEKEVEKYLHWVLEAEESKARFVAGTGARFAVWDVEGKDVLALKNTKSEKFIFPKDHTNAIMKILSSVEDEKIAICKTNKSSKSAQLMIKIGALDILFVELNPNVDYPDISKVLNDDYACRFVTKVADWTLIGKAIEATFNDELKKEHRPHNALVTPSKDNSYFFVKTNDIMKAFRKVDIVDASSSIDMPSFRCSSPYLKEVADYGEVGGNVQIEMTGIPNQPVRVRHYASDTVKDGSTLVKTNDSAGLSEKFTIFFGTLKEQ